MWREYTREMPARPGLALFATSMALGMTTALAYLVSTNKVAAAVSHRVEAPSGWPIAFRLPDRFRYVGPMVPGQLELSEDGASGYTAYAKIDPREGLDHSELPIPVLLVRLHFRYLDQDGNNKDALLKLIDAGDEDAEPVSIGPLNGWMSVGDVGSRGVRYAAAGAHPCGLAVRIEMDFRTDSSRGRKIFEAICESVSLREWIVKGGRRS